MRLHQLALVASLAVSVPAALAAQTSTTNTNQNGNTTTTTTTTIDQNDQNSQGNDRNGSQTSGQSGSQTSGQNGSQSGSTSGTTGTTSGTTDRTAAQTGSVTAQTSSTPSDNNYSDHPASRFIASGFIGSNYSNNSASMPGGVTSTTALSSAAGGVGTDTSSDQSLDFGFSAGWLWHSMAGVEFVAGFTPNFNLANSFVGTEASPALNTYMFNLVGTLPLGAEARFQPYVSGGWGAMTLRGASLASGLSLTGTSSTTSGSAVNNAVNDVFDPDESRGAGDIGGGIMAFMGGWGVRGDIRYFRAFGSSSSSLGTNSNTSTSAGTTTSSTVVTGLLPSLDFWRANIGLAFRF
jgi:hypothetical protein